MKKTFSPEGNPECPCGSARPLTQCCGPYHAGVPAPDVKTLMRSRYTAYVLGNQAYLLATWHPSTRPPHLDLDAEGDVRWLGLEVRGLGALDACTATVEFVARYKIGGRAHRLHETSRFSLEGDRWLYLDGDIHAPTAIRRGSRRAPSRG